MMVPCAGVSAIELGTVTRGSSAGPSYWAAKQGVVGVTIHVNVSRTAKTLRRGVRAGEILEALLKEAVPVANFAVENICASSTL